MNNALWFLIGFICFLGALLLHDAKASDVVTVNFTTVVINAKGTNIESCLVQRGQSQIVIPAPCVEVAAEMRREMCHTSPGLDVDATFQCPRNPTVTLDFVIDGKSWARI